MSQKRNIAGSSAKADPSFQSEDGASGSSAGTTAMEIDEFSDQQEVGTPFSDEYVPGRSIPVNQSQQSGDDGVMHPHEISVTQRSSTENYDMQNSASFEAPSSLYNYIKENGRTYHVYKSPAYNYPNDTDENDRLDLQHKIFTYIMHNRHHLAPLDPKKELQVLDIGCGTGEWAIDMGDKYPNFEVQGIDLSPIQPTNVPPNVGFYVDDASEYDWNVEPGRFDFVHTRAMLGSFSSYGDIIKRALHYMKPGGYMESQEIMFTPTCEDGSMPPDWPFLDWTILSDEAAEKGGKPLTIAHKLKGWYEEAGFVDVREEVFKMPMNEWPLEPMLKNLGVVNELNWLAGIAGFTYKPFQNVLGWTKDQIEVYLVNVRKSISDRNVHVYHKIYVVWGRKPTEAEMNEKNKTKAT